jgi:IS30 family transposase
MTGHWEGDLITGSNQNFIATLVERNSRYVILVKVQGKETANVTVALNERPRKTVDYETLAKRFS